MKKKIMVVLVVLIAFVGLQKDTIKANNQPELIKMRATAYCLDGKTASGDDVRYGICASGHSEWLDKTVIMYQRLPNGNVGSAIGIFEVKDTGCDKNVIDVWMPESKCQKFMDEVYEDGCDGRVYVQVLDAKG